MKSFDVIIIGGGILGLSTAMQLLQKNQSIKLALLEKENAIAKHQTGNNSGVIHSGIYYKPGSLKAKNCIEGVRRLLQFCDKNQIKIEKCGKLILATDRQELPRLNELERRGLANGVAGLCRLSSEQIKEIEPHSHGIEALYSPNTGIIDFTEVAKAYANQIESLGGQIFLSQCVKKIHFKEKSHFIQTDHQEFMGGHVINCAGVYADRLANQTDSSISGRQIIPFRGEYYELIPEKRYLVKGLIYPVPDPKFPFLGVHLSKTITGEVEAGPNAILALSRNGYRGKDITIKDCLDYISYPGFWKMAFKYWKIGLYEIYRSLSKKAFTKALQRLIPELQENDLVPADAGVRSQVVLPNGTMQDDFLIIQRPGITHVLNAPSPAATASLAIGDHICNIVQQQWNK